MLKTLALQLDPTANDPVKQFEPSYFLPPVPRTFSETKTSRSPPSGISNGRLRHTLDEVRPAAALAEAALAGGPAHAPGRPVRRARHEALAPGVLERGVGAAAQRGRRAELAALLRLLESFLQLDAVRRLGRLLVQAARADGRSVAVLVDVLLGGAAQVVDALRGLVVPDHQYVAAVVVVRLSVGGGQRGMAVLV